MDFLFHSLILHLSVYLHDEFHVPLVYPQFHVLFIILTNILIFYYYYIIYIGS